MNRIIAVSGGKDSTALALRMAELYPGEDFDYVCTPTGNELPEMVAHMQNLERLLGKEIRRIELYQGKDGLFELIKDQKMIPNYRARFCTRMLKIEPMIAYLKSQSPCVQYVGLRADEEARIGIYGEMPGVEQSYPMQAWGWGIDEVWEYLKGKDVSIPWRTDCGLCFFQRLDEWKSLLYNNPGAYAHGEEIEAMVGKTFRSASRDTWEASLAGLRQEFEDGRELRASAASKRANENCDRDMLCRVCTL